MSLGQYFDSVHEFLSLSFFFFSLKKKKRLNLTEACWCLCSFERRVGTCVTHRLPGFAVGWEFLLLQSSSLLGKCSVALGSVHASRRVHSRGMRKWSTCRQLTVYSKVSENKQERKENLNLSEILFWAYCISVVHGAPWVEVRSFFFYLLFSDQAWAFSLFSFFRGFSVELNTENTASMIYPSL